MIPPAVLKWVLIVAACAALLAGAYQKGYANAAEARAERIGALEQALKDNEGVLTTLREENARWEAQSGNWKDKADAAILAAQRDLGRLARDNARLKRELDEVYREDATAAAWADARVPRAVADRLRQ